MTIIRNILEARKELSDKQKLHIDQNNNGKIDSKDLEVLRAKRDDVYTSDYKLDKNGHKTKAHKISFKTGEHEVKGESFKPMDEPKYSSSIQARQKEADKIMTNTQNKKHEDIAKGMKKSYKGFVQHYGKDRAGMNEEMHPEADKVLKHIKPEHHDKYKPDLAKGIYKGDFADRTAVLKAAKNAGHLKEDLDEVDMPLNESYDPADYEASHEKSQFGGHRAKLTNKKTGKVSYLGATGYHKPEHAKGEAEAYRTSYNHSGKSHPGAAYSHDKAISAYRKKAKEAGHIAEANAFHIDKRPSIFMQGTSTKHDVKKISTGTVYTKQRDPNGISKEFKRDPDEAKRGRGRPKKNSFGEAVQFLMGLDEQTFDSFMEEGFDSFMEQYEQLDELSRATLGDYAKRASRDSTITRKIAADFENQAKKARSSGMKAASTALADKYKSKSWKRRDGVDQAIDKLTK